MVTRWFKTILIVVLSLCLIGGLLFGKDLVSYMRSSAKSVQSAVKSSVPIEFELRRARDLLEEIIPEMHANIRLIAQEEVEVAALKGDITKSTEAVATERTRIDKCRQVLNTQLASYSIAGQNYSRDQLTEDLACRFARFKEAQVVLESKKRLLAAREKSLHAAMQLLERTRAQKRLLRDKIESLEAQHRLVQAAAVGSAVQIDNSKLAQTEKLITQIKKRLDVAERVLAHESRFVQTIQIDTISEKDLLTEIDDYFTPAAPESPEFSMAEKTPESAAGYMAQ